MQMLETALVITVRGLPAAVPEARRRLDPTAALGVPEHITVLYPFVPPGGLDEGVAARLMMLCSRTGAFDFELVAVRWFGEEVLWLAPEPADPFRALTLRIAVEFGTPPYGGVYENVVPHMTVAHRAPVGEMRVAAETIGPLLPQRDRATELALFGGGPDGWKELRRFPLGRAESGVPRTRSPKRSR